jgi:hypothetical protein
LDGAIGGEETMREFEIYVPLHYNDGSPIETEKLDGLRQRLFHYFGGLTDTRQRNAGTWKVGNVAFHDEVVIYRVLAVKQHPARRFLMDLKEELQLELRQQDILIVEREVEVL